MRKLCWFALPFCAAVFAVGYGLPPSVLFPVGAAAAIVGILSGCLKRLPVCLACLGLALGLLWTQCYAQIFRAPAEALNGQTAPFSATVINWPAQTSTQHLRVQVRLHLEDAIDPKVLLHLPQPDTAPAPGDIISGTASFSRPDIVRGEQVTYLQTMGIDLQASAAAAVTVEQAENIPVFLWPVFIARAMKESVGSLFPEDVSGLLCALLTGDKSLLNSSDYTALQRTGMAHIVAVSGLHLSFFAGFLALFFRRHSKSGALLTILFIVLFAAVAGFTPSVLRAAFMVTMTLLAPLAGRENDSPTTLTAALFVLLLINPYCALSVSLQLSFASVAGIQLAAQPLHRAMTRSLSGAGSLPKRLLRQFAGLCSANLSVTLSALLFTTPLCAVYFGSVSLIAPVANLLVLWAVSLAFAPGLFLTLLAIALPGPAAVLAFPVTLLSRYILSLARALSSLSFASIPTNGFYLCTWLVFVYFLLLAVLLRRVRRPVLPLCAGVVTLCAALLLTRFSITAHPLTVTMLDVGQGQAVLLSSGGRTALIDCGGSQGSVGDLAADHLQSLGVSELDLLILTHCHDDHANGVPELLHRMEVSNLILPDLKEPESAYRGEILALAQQQGTDITLLSDNRALTLGETTLTLYAPLADGGANEEGLSVLASCGSFDLLVTGDANDFVESLLVKYNDLPDIEVLVAGHHGSGSSTCALLLDTVTPEICLISVGYNTYGQPAEETLTRLQARDIDIYRTDVMGNLTICYKGD